MSIFDLIFDRPDRQEASLHYLAEKLLELEAERRRAHALESAYRNLRREITSRCCENGRDNPTLEPLASILRRHDTNVDACGYGEFVPR